MALYRIANEDIDDEALILNLLNALFDLVRAAGVSQIAAVERVLYPFADHLTFSKEFGAYLNAEGERRREVLDAVLWCIGAVVSHATLLRPPQRRMTPTATERPDIRVP